MAKERVVRVRVAVDERKELHDIAAWRGKPNLSDWLREFINSEVSAYRRAQHRRAATGQAGECR